MRNFEMIKTLSPENFAYMVCIDKDGEQRGCCTLCQRFFQDNCDDRCVVGVTEWLLAESKVLDEQ